MTKFLLLFIILLFSFSFSKAQHLNSNDVIIYGFSDYTYFAHGNDRAYVPDSIIIGDFAYFYTVDDLGRGEKMSQFRQGYPSGWVATLNEWVYKYDSDNNIIQTDRYNNHTINSQIFYTYNEDSRLVMRTYGTSDFNEFIYNENGQITEVIYSTFEMYPVATRKTVGKHEYIYEEGSLKEDVFYSYADGEWVEDSTNKTYYTCDDYGNVVELITQYQGGNVGKYTYSYAQDKKGNWINKDLQIYSWSKTSNDWTYIGEALFYYTLPITTSVEDVMHENRGDIYMSANTLRITYSDVASVQLYNLTGQKVLQAQGVYEVNLNSLLKGVYIVNVILENGEAVSKKIHAK